MCQVKYVRAHVYYVYYINISYYVKRHETRFFGCGVLYRFIIGPGAVGIYVCVLRKRCNVLNLSCFRSLAGSGFAVKLLAHIYIISYESIPAG